MNDAADDGEAVADLARRYLDLWIEHWAASLASPETAAAMTRLLGLFGAEPEGVLEGLARARGARDEPASFRTAYNAGDGRSGELESRVAALERRLAELEGDGSTRTGKRSLAGNAAKPRGKPRRG